jgi:hypothetical protein
MKRDRIPIAPRRGAYSNGPVLVPIRPGRGTGNKGWKNLELPITRKVRPYTLMRCRKNSFWKGFGGAVGPIRLFQVLGVVMIPVRAPNLVDVSLSVEDFVGLVEQVRGGGTNIPELMNESPSVCEGCTMSIPG